MKPFMVAGAIVCLAFTATVQAKDETLALICDQTAASPRDADRPPGVAGVASEKIDPQIAIPACEAAAKAAPMWPPR